MEGAALPEDRYRRLELLGEGGSAQVWLVEDRSRPGRRLALKQPLDDDAAHAAAIRHEYVALTRLRHPGLVEAFDLDEDPATGRPRFSLEQVVGKQLGQIAAEDGPEPFLEVVAETTRTIAFLHDLGLIHRDLKPGNVLVRERPRLGCRVVLLDLGLAVDESAENAEASSGVSGTLPYLAPELFGGEAASVRSDLYSLGALVHEALHSEPPIPFEDAETMDAFVDRVRAGRRRRPALPDGLPEGLAGWISELLSPDPALRPASATEALARLNASCGTALPLETAVDRSARLASDPAPGRDAIFAALWQLLDAEGGPRIVCLDGPAGVGKSRLLGWLQTEAVRRGWHVLAPPPGVALLEPTALLAESRRRAATRSTLLLFDDLEGGDPGTVRLLDRLGRESHEAGVRAVAALRSAEVTDPRLERLLRDVGSVPTLERLTLGPLGEDALRTVAERAAGGQPISEARLRGLVAATEGNPLLVEAALVEDRWRTDGAPERVAHLERSARTRAGLLSDHAGNWLEALVVLGPDAEDGWIEDLASLDRELAREAAEEARAAGLARIEHGRWSPESRALAQTILETIPVDRRVPMFRRAAARVEAGSDREADPNRLALLWNGAGEPDKAAAAAERAAGWAARRGLPDEAARRYAFAIRQSPPRGSRRLALRRRQSEALQDAGFYRAAARALGGALRLCKTEDERADLLGRQAHALVLAGRFNRARSSAAAALAACRSPQLTAERGRALIALGVAEARLGNETAALEHLEQAHGIVADGDDRLLAADALQNLAVCKARLERADAEIDFQRAVELYRREGRPGSELKSLLGLASLRIRDGRSEQAAGLLDEVRDGARESGQLDLVETALSKLASVATEQGRLDRALTLGREALDQALHLGDPNRVLVDRCRVAEVLIGVGRPGEAVELLRTALTERAEGIEPDMTDSARMLLAHGLLETPGARDDEAGTLLEHCLDGFRGRRRNRPLLMALVIELERRSRHESAVPFEPVYLEFEALAASYEAEVEPEIRIRSELARGRYMLDRGNPAGARDEARSAARLADDAGRPDLGARAQGLLGSSLVRLGDEADAGEALDHGVSLLEEAARRIGDASIRETFTDRRAFAELKERGARGGAGDQRRLVALYDMIRALNSESDPDVLLETILDMALRAVSAERGMILLRDPGQSDRFSVHLARNLEQETRDDAESFSRRIVARAGEGRSILTLNATTDDRFRDLRSVSLYGIQSLMCVPLRSRGTIVGTVYLDSRQAGALLTQEDLRFLEAFADHAALALENARERAALVDENRRLRSAAENRVRYGNIVGRSRTMQAVFDLIEKVADSHLPVLIQGESGTGKELVARAIHFHGPRKRRVFLTENCAAIPETLLESELFGHVRGAFTGAERDRAGLFEQADGGTLFLDEVGDMSSGMQARLLRVIQEGELRRVGGDRTVRVDVRVVTATHRDLAAEVEAGRFREDLLYRLQVVPIHLPPLRERPEDISPLIDDLIERISRERGREVPPVAAAVRTVLERHDWPGNVRELENTLQRLALLAGDGPITLEILGLDDTLRPLMDGPGAAEQPAYSFRDAAREQLRKALDAAGGNRERAARLLGISRATIYRKIKDLEL